MPSPTFTATVMPSGCTILVQLFDGSGNPSNLVSLLSPDELQQIAINALPAGSAFALPLGGHTTSSIPVSTIAPATYGYFTLPVIAGHAYRVSVFCQQGNPDAIWTAYDGSIQVSGANVLATMEGPQTRPATGAPNTITDGTTPDSQPAVWRDLGPSTGITPTGTTLTVRVTGSDAIGLAADGVRVQDLTAGGVTYYDDRDGFLTVVGDWIPLSASPSTSTHFWQGTDREGSGHGNANRLACDPAAIRSALEALPGIGAGNVLVTALGQDNTGPYTLRYTGTLAGQSVAVPTSSDAGVVVSRTSAGGQYPTLSINGGSPITLDTPIYAVGEPFLFYRLYQSSPQHKTRVFGQDGFTRVRGWGFPVTGGYGAGYFGQGNTPGDCLAKYAFGQFRPGETFTIAVTWPADASYSANALWTVADLAGTVLGGPYTLSQKVAPSGVSYGGSSWSQLGGTFPAPADGGFVVSLTNGDADPLVADSVLVTRTSADASVVVQSGDVVTVTVPAGWATVAS